MGKKVLVVGAAHHNVDAIARLLEEHGVGAIFAPAIGPPHQDASLEKLSEEIKSLEKQIVIPELRENRASRRARERQGKKRDKKRKRHFGT